MYICIIYLYLNTMKKVCILFVSCILWFCSFGQGTAYLTKSHASGYSKLIRQYSNSPGQHVVIFTDDVTDTKCYIGVTDVYTNINYVQTCDKCTIYDLEVLGDTAFFCGQTLTNKGLLGWNDVVTTLTHRLEAGVYGFVLREFDLSQAFVSYNVPMTSAHYVKYNYSIGDLYDFRYNVPLNMYTLFQNYELTPSDYKDVVTKIDFSSGTPSTVESDYHNIPYQDMVSMSLSDSAMYVVYGYDMTSKAFVFWKDYQKVSASGRCLGADFLPVHTLSTISPGIVVGTVAGTYCPGSTSPQTRTPINKRIYNLCH